MEKGTDIRKKVLDDAAKAVLTDRNAEYGEPEDSFQMIAELWRSYLKYPVNAMDVGVMLALMKVARIRSSCGRSRDSFVDLAGYAACAASIAAGYYEDETSEAQE